MNRTLKLTSLILAGGFMMSLVLGVVYAQEDEDVQLFTTQTTQVQDIAQERQARIEARKAAAQEKIETKRLELIERKCTAAQKKIEAQLVKLEASSTKRTNTYNHLITKLTEFADRFEAKGADTAQLRDGLATLSAMSSDLSFELESYIDAIGDLASMDCNEDPEGFQVTLEEARELSKEARNGAKELHDYLRGDVREMFTTMMNAFNASDNADADNDNDADDSEN